MIGVLTRPSVNYAKDWLDLWGSQQPFSCVFGHFRHGDKQPTEQLGDPRASLLLTSEKAVFCNKVSIGKEVI